MARTRQIAKVQKTQRKRRVRAPMSLSQPSVAKKSKSLSEFKEVAVNKSVSSKDFRNLASQWNSAQFQNLLFENDELEDFEAAEEGVKEAIKFAHECKLNMDNSRLYGCQELTSERSGSCMLALWAQMYGFDSKIVEDLFDVLIQTNAHKSADVSLNNFYKMLGSFEPSIPQIKCMLRRPDIFAFPEDATFFVEMLSLDDRMLSERIIELVSERSDAYELFNSVSDEGCPLEMAISSPNSLGTFLAMMPLVDLDVYESDRWCSAEEWAKSSDSKWLIQEARVLLEGYRMAKLHLVTHLCQTGELPISLDVCKLIEDYGSRPLQQKKAEATLKNRQ